LKQFKSQFQFHIYGKFYVWKEFLTLSPIIDDFIVESKVKMTWLLNVLYRYEGQITADPAECRPVSVHSRRSTENYFWTVTGEVKYFYLWYCKY